MVRTWLEKKNCKCYLRLREFEFGEFVIGEFVFNGVCVWEIYFKGVCVQGNLCVRDLCSENVY